MIYRTRKAHGRRAVAVVEAAVALPIIVVFVVGIVDLGRLMKVSNCLSNAARNGAQYGSANTTLAGDTAGIRAAAVTEMANLPGVNGTNPSLSPTPSVVTHGGQQFLRVTVKYDLTGTSFFNVFSVNTMSQTVEMPMMPQ
jgi:Flp pilus assembly protein TadG